MIDPIPEPELLAARLRAAADRTPDAAKAATLRQLADEAGTILWSDVVTERRADD